MPHHFEPATGRKHRRSLVVDVLEDRRLLSGTVAIVQGPVSAVVRTSTVDSEDGPAYRQADQQGSIQAASTTREDGSTDDGQSAESALADPGTSPTAVDEDPTPVAAPNAGGAVGPTAPANLTAAKGSGIEPVPLVGSSPVASGGVTTLAVPHDEAMVDEDALAVGPAAGADPSMTKGAAVAMTATDRPGLIGPGVLSARSVDVVGGPLGHNGSSPREWRPSTSALVGRGEAMDFASALAAQARPADLLASFSPFDRATLEQAIDQLLDRFGELEAGLPHWNATEGLASQLLASAMVIGAAEVVRRRLRATEEDDDDSAHRDRSASPFGLPDLPHIWAREEL
ncbi:MAG: hypothetical protein P4L84_23570 [Isosphaeraceae bacterium]|nr:hypothetical protein [Isosphaeraceae bacterium]